MSRFGGPLTVERSAILVYTPVMAGFAVFMTFLTYGFFGLVAASAASVSLYLIAKQRFRNGNAGTSGRRVMIASALAPFLTLFWLLAAFLIHVQISHRLARQDCGLGLSPDPYVTLPNGYVLGSANTYDGYFKAPGFETGVPVAGPGYVRSIIDLQLSDGVFTGTQFDFKTSSIRHFVFDTRTRKYQILGPENPAGHELRTSDPKDLKMWEQAETSAHNDANSYWKLYAQYRHHWPKYVFIVLIVAGECGIGFWVWKLWTATVLPSA